MRVFSLAVGRVHRGMRIVIYSIPKLGRLMKRSLGSLHVSVAVLCGFAIAQGLVSNALAGTIFQDNYTTNDATNYTAAFQSGGSGTWTVNPGSPGNVTYNSGVGSYSSSVFLLNPSVANTSSYSTFTTSGEIINPGGIGNQPGLVVSGDTSSGGYVIQTDDTYGSPPVFALLQQTGSELLSDEGGGGSPVPVMVKFGQFTATDSFLVSATVTRNPSGDAITASVYDLTTSTYLDGGPQTVTSTIGDYGGDEIGWRNRQASSGQLGYSLTGLTLSVPNAVPEPSSIALFGLGTAGMFFMARRRRTQA